MLVAVFPLCVLFFDGVSFVDGADTTVVMSPPHSMPLRLPATVKNDTLRLVQVSNRSFQPFPLLRVSLNINYGYFLGRFRAYVAGRVVADVGHVHDAAV